MFLYLKIDEEHYKEVSSASLGVRRNEMPRHALSKWYIGVISGINPLLTAYRLVLKLLYRVKWWTHVSWSSCSFSTDLSQTWSALGMAVLVITHKIEDKRN